MNPSESLAKAWQSVQDAGIPESLWEVAFKEAIARIDPVAAPPSAQGADSGGGKSSLAEHGETDEGAIYSKLAKETGADEVSIRDVLHIDGDGQVTILAPSHHLGKNTAEQMRSVAVLIVGARHKGMGETEVSRAAIVDAMKERSCYDSSNFVNNLKSLSGVKPKGKGAFVASSKLAGEFKAAIESAAAKS